MIDASRLFVITAIANPVRYASRYALYQTFEKYVKQSGANLYTGEVAFGERPHVVTDASDPTDLQLRSSHEIWMKERVQNLVVPRLPPEAEYIAFVDADVRYERDDWAVETIQQLQHYDVVQMFSHVVDLGPETEIVQTHYGFAYSYLKGKTCLETAKNYGKFWHPGYAWAMRRSTFDALGGLIDIGILGAGDHHMATALIGNVGYSIPGNISEAYKRPLYLWQQRAEAHVKRNIGYVPGTLRHQWHGTKLNRNYESRWKILIDNGFDPSRDLKSDSHGLYQLCQEGHRLRDAVRAYNRSRREDSNENDIF